MGIPVENVLGAWEASPSDSYPPAFPGPRTSTRVGGRHAHTQLGVGSSIWEATSGRLRAIPLESSFAENFITPGHGNPRVFSSLLKVRDVVNHTSFSVVERILLRWDFLLVFVFTL